MFFRQAINSLPELHYQYWWCSNDEVFGVACIVTLKQPRYMFFRQAINSLPDLHYQYQHNVLAHDWCSNFQLCYQLCCCLASYFWCCCEISLLTSGFGIESDTAESFSMTWNTWELWNYITFWSGGSLFYGIVLRTNEDKMRYYNLASHLLSQAKINIEQKKEPP
jgi:hypothetical protein